MDQETNLGVFQLISQLDGRVSIEARMRDWRLNIDLKVPDFTKLLTEDIQSDPKSPSAQD